mgnify:CR=1 FL=1
MRHTWNTNDVVSSFFDLFRTWVQGLKPNTQYRFSCRVNNLAANTYALLVYQFDIADPGVPEKPKGERLALIDIESAEGFKEYSAAFTTVPAPEFCVMIFAKCRGEGEYPASVIWDDWVLSEMAPE